MRQNTKGVTHSFVVNSITWSIIQEYAKANDISYSEALRSLVRIAKETLDKRKY